MNYRIEKDSMGEIFVPETAYYGAQTQRSLENFKIGREKMPEEIIRGIALVKKAAALGNERTGVLDREKASLICRVADEIMEGQWEEQFPLSLWQTGSGTQTNMNVNEVIAHRGNEIAGKAVLHPNDDVNKSQSSNDVFPTAMHIAFVKEITEKLLPQLKKLGKEFQNLEDRGRDVIKTGRTHLQDATPISFGQEVSGWRGALETACAIIEDSLEYLKRIPLGGTAVGTGLNATKAYAEEAVKEICTHTGINFVEEDNKFHGMSMKDGALHCHGSLKTLAMNLIKIANDLRLLASGPRCGLGEIHLPENEPGSSIMPGKVNPTQIEALTMVCAQVLGNDTAISFAASQGNLELNVYMPLIAHNFLQSVRLLSDAMESFRKNCVAGISINEEKMRHNTEISLMNVTSLNKVIGYENGARIVKKAYQEGTTLKEAALALNILTAEEFDRHMDPGKMI